MRVIQLDIETQHIQFHPYITVVRGLAPSARASMLAAFAGLAAGDAATPGLVEVHGVLLDLSIDVIVSEDNEISGWTHDIGADRAATHAPISTAGP